VFVNAVRGTGGNNLSRYLVVPGYCTTPKHTVADYFKLPEDEANQVNKLIVSFHYYDPYEFGITGARNEWGTTADKNKVNNDFQPFANKFIARGIPVIIGESGAVRHPGYEQIRLDYLAYVYGKAHETGLTPIYWDNGAFSGSGENFGLINRHTGQPNSDEARTVIETMVNATK
jgi:endoglucanase